MNWKTTAALAFFAVLTTEILVMIWLESNPAIEVTSQSAALIDGTVLGGCAFLIQLFSRQMTRGRGIRLSSSDWQSAAVMFLATAGFESAFHPLSENLAALNLPIYVELVNALLTASTVAVIAGWLNAVEEQVVGLNTGKSLRVQSAGKSVIIGAIVSALCVTAVAGVRELNQSLTSYNEQLNSELGSVLARQRGISQKIGRIALLHLQSGGQLQILVNSISLAEAQGKSVLNRLLEFESANAVFNSALQSMPAPASIERNRLQILRLARSFAVGDRERQLAVARELQATIDEFWPLVDRSIVSITAVNLLRSQQDGTTVGNVISTLVLFVMSIGLLWPLLRLMAAQKAKIRFELRNAEHANQNLIAYQRALDSHAIFSVTDRMGKIILFNDHFRKITGYGSENLLGQNHRLLNSNVHSPEFFAEMWHTISQGQTWRNEVCNRNQEGGLYWLDSCVMPLMDGVGKIEKFVSISYDITERKRTQVTSERRVRLEHLLEHLRKELFSSGSMFCSTANLLEELNALTGAHASLVCEVGRSRDELAWSLVLGHHRSLQGEVACDGEDGARLLKADAQPPLVQEVVQQDGLFGGLSSQQLGAERFHGIPINVGFEPVGILLLSDNIDLVHFVEEYSLVISALADLISARRESDRRRSEEEKVRRQAKRDPLTGLGNRRDLTEEFDSRRDHPDANFALLLIDLDRFKPINDTYGHLVGDTVLRVIAERLRTIARGDITVSRIGGDEFAILTEARAREDEAESMEMAHRILEELARPIDCGGHEILVGASVGVALYPRDGASFQELLHRADAAMYRAKGNRSEAQVFNVSMDEAIRYRAELETDLKKAIEAGDIEPWFQPYINLRTGVVAGHEVLARWKHEKRGFVAPTEFIKIAEEAGLVDKLFRQFLHSACLKHMEQNLGTMLSINLSPAQIKNPLFAKQLVEDLDQIGFPPHLLEVEITETSMIGDLERARPLLLLLRSKGIKIALDDFGTGYSSLSLLRNMPITKVKIDRSFTADVEVAEGTGVTIVNAILGIAKALRLQVTAEGIETEEVAEFLRDIGCEYGQGYLYARAQPEFVTVVAHAKIDPRRRLMGGENH